MKQPTQSGSPNKWWSGRPLTIRTLSANLANWLTKIQFALLLTSTLTLADMSPQLDTKTFVNSLTLSLPEWSISNFSCSLTSNITSHSMKNLAFHSLLRWKMIILPILTTYRTHSSLKGCENVFLNFGAKGLTSVYMKCRQSVELFSCDCFPFVSHRPGVAGNLSWTFLSVCFTGSVQPGFMVRPVILSIWSLWRSIYISCIAWSEGFFVWRRCACFVIRKQTFSCRFCGCW